MATESLSILISAVDKASSVLKGVGQTARAEMKGVTDAAAGSATGWTKASAAVEQHATSIRAAGVATTAFGALTVGVLAKCVQAAGESQVASAKLASAIQATGQAIDQAKLERYASQLQKITPFADDATVEMMAMLTSFNLTEKQIIALTPRVQNIAALMGIDLHSAAVAVGKAIATGNVAALQRFGIVIDEATKKSGDFDAMLRAIDRNTGPAAEKLGKTLPGAAAIAANQLDDLQETIGLALAPALTSLVTAAVPVVGVFKSIAESPVGPVIIGATIAVGGLATILGPFITLLPSLVAGWNLLTGAQLRNAEAANIAAAANARAATAAGAGGAAALGGGAATAAGGALGTAGAVATGAAGRGLLGRAGGVIGRVARSRPRAGLDFRFRNLHGARFGAVPDSMAATGYDAAMVAGDAISRAKDTTGEAIAEAIAATKDYPGVTGVMYQRGAFKEQLTEVKGRMKGGTSAATPAAGTPPPTNGKGWKLHKDKNGNLAYVSPDGKQAEEVK